MLLTEKQLIKIIATYMPKTAGIIKKNNKIWRVQNG